MASSRCILLVCLFACIVSSTFSMPYMPDPEDDESTNDVKGGKFDDEEIPEDEELIGVKILDDEADVLPAEEEKLDEEKTEEEELDEEKTELDAEADEIEDKAGDDEGKDDESAIAKEEELADDEDEEKAEEEKSAADEGDEKDEDEDDEEISKDAADELDEKVDEGEDIGKDEEVSAVDGPFEEEEEGFEEGDVDSPGFFIKMYRKAKEFFHGIG